MKPLPPRTLRLLAATADVDTRTITRYLTGQAVRPSGADRIRRAIEQLGISLSSTGSESQR